MTDLIINICIALSLILIWIDTPPFKWFREKLGMDGMPDKLKTIKDYIQYLINCGGCISFWVGVFLAVWTFNLGYLILPLLLRIIERRLL